MCRATLIFVTLLAASSIGGLPAGMDGWQTAGDAQRLKRDGTRLTIDAPELAIAGLVSPPRPAAKTCDAVLVSADIARADAGAMTFAILNDRGDTIGYWQNARPLPDGRVHALLPLTMPTTRPAAAAGRMRLFVGTHGRHSTATIGDVTWQPVRRGIATVSTMYGALVHGSNAEAQSFKSRGKRLAAVRVLIRRMKDDDGPDLRVRLYPADKKAGAALPGTPLAEAVVPRERIPRADERREWVAIAIAADTVPGSRYAIEFSTTDPCSADGGFLMWAGLDEYPDGSRYQNSSPVADWDLHLETYDGM